MFCGEEKILEEEMWRVTAKGECLQCAEWGSSRGTRCHKVNTEQSVTIITGHSHTGNGGHAARHNVICHLGISWTFTITGLDKWLRSVESPPSTIHTGKYVKIFDCPGGPKIFAWCRGVIRAECGNCDKMSRIPPDLCSHGSVPPAGNIYRI